jgi:hypothetical protein
VSGRVRAAVLGLSTLPVVGATCGVAEGQEPRSEIISVVLLRGAACDRVQPGFRDLSARAFARWRRFAPDAIAAVERSREFQARLAEVTRLPAGSARRRDRQEAAALCGDDFISHLETLGRDADPRLATPESTWRTFVAALRAGDRNAALAVMSDATRERQRRRFEEQSPEALRKVGNSFDGLEFKPSLGPFQVAVASRRDGEPATIFFERSWNGDWRIASI